jgi:hypothetical protein
MFTLLSSARNLFVRDVEAAGAVRVIAAVNVIL